MPIDLQKLQQKFDALFEDENIVTEFEQWLEVRNVSQNDGKPIVMRSLPSDDELSKIFESYSDCYADTGRFENDGSYREGEVIQAMTKERFIEAVKLLGNDA